MGPLLVAGMIGAIEGKVAQRREPGFDLTKARWPECTILTSAPPLAIIDSTRPLAFGHRLSLGDKHPHEKCQRLNMTCYGTGYSGARRGSRAGSTATSRRQQRGARSSMWLTGRQPAASREYGRADPEWLGYGCADQPPVQRRELGYGSREFRAASDLARRLPHSPRVSALIGNVVRHPPLIRVLIAVWQLPLVDLRVRREDADAWLGAVGLGGGIDRDRRWAQAVLDLPTVEERYLVGRAKQALRTNLRHARALGVTSERIPTYEAWLEAANVILRARRDGPAAAGEMGKPGPGRQVAYYVARDADEMPLAFAGVALFGQFAELFAMHSRHHVRHPSASWARYQLHTFLVLDLGCSGVKHLIAGSALRETAGNQYFQHLLGYRACNLHVETIESGAT